MGTPLLYVAIFVSYTWVCHPFPGMTGKLPSNMSPAADVTEQLYEVFVSSFFRFRFDRYRLFRRYRYRFICRYRYRYDCRYRYRYKFLLGSRSR